MAKFKVVISGVDTSTLKVLSGKESEELIRLYLATGEDKYVNQAVEGNLKLVLSSLKRFSDRYDNLDDLFQIGTIGLIKAVRNFDLSQNVRFSTYAVPMIIGEIKRFLRDNTPLRVSRQLKEIAYKALRLKEEVLQKENRELSNEEIATILNVSNFQLKEALSSLQQVYSLSDPVFNDEESYSYIETVSASEEELGDFISNRLTLAKGLKMLSTTQKKVIYDRYYNDRTQLEIAAEFGISQAQVSRIEKNAINILKSLF